MAQCGLKATARLHSHQPDAAARQPGICLGHDLIKLLPPSLQACPCHAQLCCTALGTQLSAILALQPKLKAAASAPLLLRRGNGLGLAAICSSEKGQQEQAGLQWLL